jgi:hypothetical protein
MHEPADIAANDNRRPAGRLERGALTLELEVREGVLRPEGDTDLAYPRRRSRRSAKSRTSGPLIRVPQGTELRVKIRNAFPDSTLSVCGLTSRPTPGDTGARMSGNTTRES